MHIQFNFVQQCIQISTEINSPMYVCTSVFVSFETSNNMSNIQHKPYMILSNQTTNEYESENLTLTSILS